MKRNPLLKASDRALKIYGNSLTVNFRNVARVWNADTGELEDGVEYASGEVSASESTVFKTDIPSGKGYLAGDVLVRVSRMELERIIPDFRTADAAACGVKPESDTVTFAGIEYRIVKIEPFTIWANTPAEYRFHLRANAGETVV